MVTQYDAVAEIEAMKWKGARSSRRAQVATAETPAPVPFFCSDGSEAAIRQEMERRLARRAARVTVRSDTTAS